VNRHRTTPLYRQVAEAIEHQISSGELERDERLPGEAELAERYEVNRLTVRSALAELVQRGLIYTVHGRGSYVSAPPIRHDISSDREASLTLAMRDSGHEASQRLLSSAEERSPEVARKLKTRGRIRRYELLRTVDGMPWTLSSTWLPARRFGKLDRHWTGEESLYEVLEREFGVRMRRSDRTIRTEAAGPAAAEHLMVPVGFPLLVMEGLNVDKEGTPVALVEHRGRGDRVQFTVRLDR